ncbi:hypothetical protein N7466_010205 [Penicillium verhagenii]|uniref:uncharacterized protein n=1 Tax=Penicillium verhagenii TaxID=1562060 RepID=UPI00254569A3|nr:uncharacterized protein N7466_010205 [Penicillium verhagenii]KAJ5919262.1 hypothetical protein N7466_010205 [Penicillium verhagenii]
MATVASLVRSTSRGSDHESSYASPLITQMIGGSNHGDGKLGADGRKRRSFGSSDDEGGFTYDNLPLRFGPAKDEIMRFLDEQGLMAVNVEIVNTDSY